MSFKSIVQCAIMVAVILSVVACTRKNPLQVTISDCPAVAVIGDMGSYTRIKGDSSLAKDIEYTATVSNLQITCEQEEVIQSVVTFDISAVAGPALTGQSITVEYFVVTAKDTASLVTKNSYQVTLTFDRQGRAFKSQTIEHLIPTREQARKYDYELLVGLKATPTEYYRNIQR